MINFTDSRMQKLIALRTKLMIEELARLTKQLEDLKTEIKIANKTIHQLQVQVAINRAKICNLF